MRWNQMVQDRSRAGPLGDPLSGYIDHIAWIAGRYQAGKDGEIV